MRFVESLIVVFSSCSILLEGFKFSTLLLKESRFGVLQATKAPKLATEVSLDTTKTKPGKAKNAAVEVSASPKENDSYGSQSITVLKGLDPVRKRPGMYIGSTSQRGLHHLIFEVVDNSVDESLAGHCNVITVTMQEDGSIQVTDNGRGIPCDVHPSTGKSSLETVLCVLHAGGKFGGEESGYKVSGGLHGVGLSVVNALSETLTVEVVRGGKHNSMICERGVPATELVVRPVGADDISRGTRVTFKPDPQIFKTTLEFDFDKVAARMDELAYLNAGLTIHMVDMRKPISKTAKTVAAVLEDPEDSSSGRKVEDKAGNQKDGKSGKKDNSKAKSKSTRRTVIVSAEDDNSAEEPLQQVVFNAAGEAFRSETYRHDGGIKELVASMCVGKTNLHPTLDVIGFQEERKDIVVEVALRWSKDMYNENLSGFANGIRTGDGGSHLDGLKFSVTKTINAMAKKTGKIKDVSIPGEFLREGLTAVISVKVPEPEFEGQTKTRLGNPEVRSVVDAVVSEQLQTLFEWNPQLLSDVCNKALEAQSAAVAAKAARDMVRRKSLLQSTVLPGKLSDCASRNPSECEIYLVEGDSAAGSAKLGRDRSFQAILPLKGKILNIEKASTEKIYQNTELQALISALGLGVRGVEFDEQQLRYHRIVIMTDADVDGAHIRLLILTFLYRYQRELIQKGFVFIACPPLFKMSARSGPRKGETYLYSQESMEEFMQGLTPEEAAAISIQRFKGLGEMMPGQLWDTTMDPTKRTLKLVNIEDATAADRLFTVLMGDSVQPRKEFIISNVDGMKLADLDY